jgi:hypothetical protein
MLDLPFKYAYLRFRSMELDRFLASARNARQIQHQGLFNKLRRHRESAFGRDHAFSEIRSIDDFRRRVPISDYSYFSPYIERVKQGEVTAMFGPETKLLMFALTSGTTAQSKFIPITDDSFRDYRHGWHLWGTGTYRDHPDLVQKKTLKLGSNWQQSFTERGVACGAISGLVSETAPWVAKGRFVLPSPVSKIDDPRVKHYVAMRLALADPRVGMIGTANPSTLLEFAQMMNDRQTDLIRDLRDGTLACADQLPKEVRQDLEPGWRRPLPKRARTLEKLVQANSHLFPCDAWPGLSVISVWTGGSVSVYLPRLEKYYGKPAIRDHGLNASEGRMTLPLRDQSSQGIVEFNHHFFEFVPVDEIDSVSPTVLEAHELEEGRDYFILLTTSGGLYRYNIRDVVRCTGFHGQAPLLIFLNKGAHFSSLTGEKISEFQVIAAVKKAQAELAAEVGEFCVAPQMQERPSYVLLTETSLSDTRRLQLADLIDRNLSEINCEYAEKRRSGRLLPLSIRDVPLGTWSRLRQKKSSARGNFEEYKHRWLVGDLKFIEHIHQESPIG